MVERRTTLLKRFKRFRELQRVHMPGFDPAQHEPDPAPVNVEDFVLHMPSGLTKARVRRFCPHGIAELEDRIWFAQATDALESVRHHLRTRSFANQFKIANVTGQIQNTRAREAQGRIDDKVRASTDEYRRARVALLKLRGPGEWETILQALNKGDVRALNERELTQQEEDVAQRIHAANGVVTELDMEHERRRQKVVSVGEGLRSPSWIWFTGADVEGLNDALTRKGVYDPPLPSMSCIDKPCLALRVEWAKAKARAEHWEFEVTLLDEEMRRVLAFGKSKLLWWAEQLPRRSLDSSGTLAQGMSAYAAKQCAMETHIIDEWRCKWSSIRAVAEPIIAGNIPDDSVDTYNGPEQLIELDFDDDYTEDELDD